MIDWFYNEEIKDLSFIDVSSFIYNKSVIYIEAASSFSFFSYSISNEALLYKALYSYSFILRSLWFIPFINSIILSNVVK